VRSLRSLLIAAAGALLAGCQTAPPPVAPAPAAFTQVGWDALPGWRDDRPDAAWPALLIGCRKLVAAPRTQATWQRPCQAAAAVDGNDARAVRSYFETHFRPWRIAGADGADTGLVTGYYEPLLRGSRNATPAFGVPLYAAPDDLLTIDLAELYPELKGKRVRGRVDGHRVVPYWPRADIDAGRAPLAGKALAYVADPLDAFFLEVQGSGRITLDDGALLRLGYADQNGHPYRSIARVLVDRGELTLERASKQSIEDWARAHPTELQALLDTNPSYVFFRVVPPPAPGTLEARIDGPQGAFGVPLLAQRTIAVDPQAIPLGAPVYLATTYPQDERPLARLTLAQDTGGAIRGTVRADFFWGTGEAAGRDAGRMRQPGRLWLLWPVDAAPPAPQ